MGADCDLDDVGDRRVEHSRDDSTSTCSLDVMGRDIGGVAQRHTVFSANPNFKGGDKEWPKTGIGKWLPETLRGPSAPICADEATFAHSVPTVFLGVCSVRTEYISA